MPVSLMRHIPDHIIASLQQVFTLSITRLHDSIKLISKPQPTYTGGVFIGYAEIQRHLPAIKNRGINRVSHSCFQQKVKQSGAVTHFLCHAIFQSEFSVLPQKSSAYLRADSPSDANSREIRVLHKPLNIKYLHTRHIFSSCKTHYFSTRYGPYHGLKRTISHHDIGEISPSNGQNQNAR